MRKCCFVQNNLTFILNLQKYGSFSNLYKWVVPFLVSIYSPDDGYARPKNSELFQIYL